MARMSVEEWRKQKSAGTLPVPATSTQPSSTNSNPTGSMSVAEWRASKATDDINDWIKSSSNLLTTVQSRAGKWIGNEDEEYKSYQEQISQMLSMADKWRNQYAGNEEAVSYINEVVDALSKTKEGFLNAKIYYDQWDSEKDYSQYMVGQGERAEMLAYDLAAGKAELDDLYAQRDEARQIQHFIDGLEWQVNEGDSSEATQMALEKLRAQLKQYGDLDSTITQKEQYYNQAKHLQDGEKLRNDAINAPDFEEFAQKVETGLPGKITPTERYMSDEQTKIYNYYLNKYGEEKADEYLYSIEESVNAVRGRAMADGADTLALKYLMGAAAGLDQFASGVKSIFSDEDYINTSAMQFASGMVREDLADTGPEVLGHSLGHVGYDLINTTANMAPSILAGAIISYAATPAAGAAYAATIGKVAGAGVLGVSAGGNAYAEKLNAGYNKEQAAAYGKMVAASEAVLQYLLGGISKMGGKLTGKSIAAIANNIDSAVGRVAAKWGMSMLAEGTEEYLQEVLTPWYENIVFNMNNDVNLLSEEALYAGLLGALSAGVLEGGSTISADRAMTRYGETLKKDGLSVERLKGLGRTFAADTVAYELAGKVDENTSAYTIARLFNEVNAQLSEQNKADIVKSLERKGYATVHAEIIANQLAAAVNGAEFGALQRYVLDHNEDIAKTFADVILNPNSTVNQRRVQSTTSLFELAKEVDKARVQAKYAPTSPAKKSAEQYEADLKAAVTNISAALAPPARTISSIEFNFDEGIPASPEALARSIAEARRVSPVEQMAAGLAAAEKEAMGGLTVSESGKVEHKPTGKEIGKLTIVSDKDKKLKLKTESGEIVDAKDVNFRSKDEAMVYSAVLNMGVNPVVAQSIVDNFDGTDGMVYAADVKLAYQYGKMNFPKSLLEKLEIKPHQAEHAYKLGRSAAKVKGGKKKRNVQYEQGSVVYESDVDESTMTPMQKAGIDGIKMLANLSSAEFHIFEGDKDNKFRFTKKDGSVISANGMYITGTNEIWIDLNAGNFGEGTMIYTAAHEISHYIRQWSPAKWQVMADFLMEQYGEKGVPVHILLERQMQKVKRRHPSLKDNALMDAAYEELVSDALSEMLVDGRVAEKMQALKKKDAGLWAKIKEAIKDLLDRWGIIRKEYKGVTPDAAEAQFLHNMDEAFSKLQDMFAEAFADADANFSVAGLTVDNSINMESDVIDSANVGILGKPRSAKMQERTEYLDAPKQAFSVSTKNGKTDAKMVTAAQIRKKGWFTGTEMSVKALRDARFKQNGFTKKQIDAMNAFIKKAADAMAEARLKYRFIGLDDVYNAQIIISPVNGSITISAMVKNGDYAVNFDFTKICKKRVALQQVIEELAMDKGRLNEDGTTTEVDLSSANIKRINDILASYGVETACLCCFVESKRYNMQSLYQEKVIDVWNRLVAEFDQNAPYFDGAETPVDISKVPDSEFDALLEQVEKWKKRKGPKGEVVEEKMRAFLENTPAARKKLRFSDLVTATGRTNLHKLYPQIESLVLQKLGTAAPKSVEAFTPYNGEIDLLEAKSGKDLVKYIASIAGVRSQSFSDFMIAHVFDVLQKTASLSARKLPAHTYTKEIARAMLFGMTGEKHNMSVLHNIDPNVDSWQAGLSEDGQYLFSDYKAYRDGYSQFIQSIGWEDAVALQNTEGYSKDCGVIAVGFSYLHMKKIHADPDVRQVIGYHTSDMPVEVKPMTHLDKSTDYTPVQNTLNFIGFAIPQYDIPDGVPSYATPPQDVMVGRKGPKTKKSSVQFDIKARFAELSAGLTGAARTAAAKQTLRELLQLAEENGLVLRTGKAKAGHGDFNLYEDLEKTGDPYVTTDHYIEYCIENGWLPMFYEFALDQNYYKDNFDFNVFDRLSYNPETGLHEDTADRKAYAPQTAVHMLNEDGTLSFPEDFFEIVDKQMQGYDQYQQYVAQKMPDIMRDIRSIKDDSGKPMISKESARDITEDPLFPFTEREIAVFKREYMDKAGGLKPGKTRRIIIETGVFTYFVEAVGSSMRGNPFKGEILKKVNTDTGDIVSAAQEEYDYATYEPTEEDYLAYQTTWGKQRRGRNRYRSLKEWYAAEGYANLLDDEPDGDAEGNRTQGSKDERGGGVKSSDRDSLTPEQQKHFDYNQKQEAVGSTLKTLKGSAIKRSTKYGVGKEIGGEIYFHKEYAEDILPAEVLSQAERLLEESHPGFEYNCLKYNPKTGVVAFQEAPDFDTAREPVVGDYVSVNTDTGVVKTGHSNYIWHHKWNWVKNDYSGFDVEESWNWSKEWLSTLTEVSDGNGIERWNAQLDKFGLPKDGESVLYSDREQEYDSKDTSVKILPATFTKFGLKPTDRVLDWGGGQYDIAKKAVEHGYPGIKFEVVDAFNRTKTHNDRILAEYKADPATVLTINNVLNVIKETEIIENVIRESKEYLAADGVCYIKIYEGNDVDGKTGNGKVTSSGWQNNQPAEWYRQFAEKYYQHVERMGDVLIASDKPIDRKSLPKVDKDVAGAMRGKVKEIAKSETSMRESLYSDRDSAYQSEEDINRLRNEIEEIDDEMLFAEGSEEVALRNKRVKLQYQLDKLLDAERRAAKPTSLQTVLDNLKKYRRGDLESIANQLTDGAWDEIDDLPTDALIDGIREVINGRELSPLEMQVAKFGVYARDVSNWKYSDRDIDSVSNRDILANAFMDVAQNDVERGKIAEYQEKIKALDEDERKLRDIRAQLHELSFSTGPRDNAKIRELREKATKLANRIGIQDKQLLRLEASKPLMAVLEREKKLAYSRASQKWEDRIETARTGRSKTEMRHKIKKIVGELNNLLLHGTKDKHIMIGLQKATAEALSAINMDTVAAEKRLAKIQEKIDKATDPAEKARLQQSYARVEAMGDNMATRLTALKNAYEEIKDSGDPLVANVYQPEIEERIKNLRKMVGDTPLRNMSMEQLEFTYDTYKMVLTTIRNANKAFKNERGESIAVLGNRSMEEIGRVGGKKELVASAMRGPLGFAWSGMKPTYAFKAIGSDTLSELFSQVRAGEDVWATDANEAKEFYSQKTKQYHYDSWDLEKEYTFTSKSGKEFKLTLEQIMSLYAYSKRKQADAHLDKGGFVFDSSIEVIKRSKLGIPVKYRVNTAHAHALSRDTLMEICKTLTDEQVKFVDEMQDYLSTVMGEKGNEVSLKMYGVKLFKEKFYFPLKSAKQFMYEQYEVAGDRKIKNSGFSKDTTPHASNPVILNNFTDVWATHVNDMAMYHAFVLPMEDFERVFNYKTPTSDTMPTESVKGYLQDAYGVHPEQYIKQLMTDLNGGARIDPTAGIINKGIALFKKSAVFASLSVVIQQPSSIARAMAYIDAKYFVGKPGLKDWDEVKKYAPVAIIKEMGYFDTNMGKSTVDFIKSKEYTGVKSKMKALVTDSQYRDEILSKAPSVADELAWCQIWNAVKKEIAETNNLQGEELLKAAGKRFTEVIVNTQVYDSVLTRSGMMRSKDTGMKMATSFMAEPTTSLNMIADALIQGKRGNKSYARKAIGAVAASMILNSILVSFVYAGRDDDEDKSYAEKYAGRLTSELIDSFNPLTLIPFVKDIVSIAQGYDVERSDMAVITDLFNAWKKLSNDNLSVYRKVEGFGGAIASIFGLPLKNIMRDVRGIYNTVKSAVAGPDTTGRGMLDAAKESLPKWMGGGERSNADQLYAAMLGGDTGHVERLKARFKDDRAFTYAVRDGLVNNDKRITAAAKARAAGNQTEYMRLAREIVNEGHFSQDDVVRAVNYVLNSLTKKESEPAEATKPDTFKIDEYLSEALSGDQAEAELVKREIIAGHVADGKTEGEALKSFNNSFKNTAVKGAFTDGDITMDVAIAMLQQYGGVEPADAYADVQYWQFKQNHPDIYVVDSWFDSYYEYASDAGIDIDVYMQYRNDVKNITGEDKKERRMAVINSLPLSAAQKDALYFDEGWVASKLYEAPWR